MATTNTAKFPTPHAAKLNGNTNPVPTISNKALADITSTSQITKQRPSKEVTLQELGRMLKEHSMLAKWGHYVNLVHDGLYPSLQIADIKIELDPMNPDNAPPVFQIELAGRFIPLWYSAGEVLEFVNNIAAFNQEAYKTEKSII
jgi:hypothetical protein